MGQQWQTVSCWGRLQGGSCVSVRLCKTNISSGGPFGLSDGASFGIWGGGVFVGGQSLKSSWPKEGQPGSRGRSRGACVCVCVCVYVCVCACEKVFHKVVLDSFFFLLCLLLFVFLFLFRSSVLFSLFSCVLIFCCCLVCASLFFLLFILLALLVSVDVLLHLQSFLVLWVHQSVCSCYFLLFSLPCLSLLMFLFFCYCSPYSCCSWSCCY